MKQEKSGSFDAAAAFYDDEFTLSEIGMRQRDRVYYWLNECNLLKASGKRNKIFELNCGTGFDAEMFSKMGYEVIATDASAEMIKVAKAKNIKQTQFYQLRFNEIFADTNVSNSDFVFSNFGGLNCLSEDELQEFITNLGAKQNKGNMLAMVIMPKFCVTEDIYLFLKGRFSQVLRRSRRDYLEVNVEGESIRTYYHSPKSVKSILSRNYKTILVKPIAHFLPPSYLEPFFKKNKWLLRYLNFMESTFGGLSFLASNADHYIIIAEKK